MFATDHYILNNAVDRNFDTSLYILIYPELKSWVLGASAQCVCEVNNCSDIATEQEISTLSTFLVAFHIYW